MTGHEEPPLTAWEKEEVWRIGIRTVSCGGGALYLALQLAHNVELLPEFLDFAVFDSDAGAMLAGLFIFAGYFSTRKKRRDTTPNP